MTIQHVLYPWYALALALALALDRSRSRWDARVGTLDKPDSPMMEHVRAPNFEIVTKMNTCPIAPDNPKRSRTGPVEYTICRRRTWQGRRPSQKVTPNHTHGLDSTQNSTMICGQGAKTTFSGTPQNAL